MEGANLVIVNHSLLFSLLGAGFGPSDDEGGVLFRMILSFLTRPMRCPMWRVITWAFIAHGPWRHFYEGYIIREEGRVIKNGG